MSSLMSVMIIFFVNFVFFAQFFTSASHSETLPRGLFLLKWKGYRLKNNLLRTISSENEVDCASHCGLDQSKCKSFNFITDPTVDVNCELNSNVALAADNESLVAHTNAMYFEKVEEEAEEEKEEIKEEPLLLSRVLGGNESWINQLQEWLPIEQRDKNMELCYRASEDGWAASTFHDFCDYQGRTIVLVKSGQYVFGGYAAIEWGNEVPGYLKSNASFIFSFKNGDRLAPFKSPINHYDSFSLYNNDNVGPVFGLGHDLYIANNADVTNNSYASMGKVYQLPSGYVYDTDEARKLLAGTRYFTPSEVEVYYFVNDE